MDLLLRLWPIILGLVFVANGIEALLRRRFFFFANRDPSAAIYREYEPGFYWGLIALNFGIAAILFGSPWLGFA